MRGKTSETLKVAPCYNEFLEHDSEPDIDDDPEMPGLAHDERDAFALPQAQTSWLRRATHGVSGALLGVQVSGSKPIKSRSVQNR